MQKTPTKPEENATERSEVMPEKQAPMEEEINDAKKMNSVPLKDLKKTECEFKTTEKNSKLNQSLEGNENKTSEELSMPKEERKEHVKTNSTPVKEAKKIECEFKTPEKIKPTLLTEIEGNENEIPEKPNTPKEERKECLKTNSTPLKEAKKIECEFKTPEKNCNQSFESKLNETPGKLTSNLDIKLEQSCDGEDGMISTTEQARLLIAASRTPSKSVNRTPVKQNTPTGKRSLENSPVTPGKHRRVELITLASPKAKRLKQI